MRWLTSEQGRRLDRMLALLEGDDRAPTTVRDREQALDAHVADSLVALELGVIDGGQRLVDLGSGAGFPGVALALAVPTAEFVLLESQRRKCEFLERMCAAGGLANTHVVCARIEEWGEGMGSNDVALARALAPQAVVLEYAAPLLREGGALIDWRGRRHAEGERAALGAARMLGMERVEVRHVFPFAGASDRHLHVFRKTRATPARFPRRAGVARKRPLG